MTLTWIDFLLFACFFLSCILGLSRGLFKEIISLCILVVAVVVTIQFTHTIAGFLITTDGAQDVVSTVSEYTDFSAVTPMSTMTTAIIMMLLFAGVYCSGEAINYYYSPTSMIAFIGVTGVISRLLGGVVGLLRGYIFSLMFIIVVGLTPIAQTGAWTGSHFLPSLLPDAARLNALINPA